MNKPLRVALVAFIVGLTMLLQPPKAFAATGFADITCGDPITGEQMTFSTGWDNSNQYFEDKGNIAALYCEGGWAGPYTIYISDSLPPNDPQRYYAGITPEVLPIEPTPILPTPIPEPVVTPSDTPMPEPTPTPSPSDTPAPDPVVTNEPTPVPVVEPEPSPEPTPEQTPQPEPEPQPTDPVVEPEPSAEPSEPPLEITLEPTDVELVEAVTDLYPDIMDGLSQLEAVALAELLTEFTADEAITFEAFEESGLDYEDLPPEQPIMLENGVILEAQVADAIEIFATVDELLATIFSDPGKAIMAAANIGADMTPIEREENQSVVVGAIVVANIASSIRRIK
jgi:hypothetical protein